MDTKLRWEVSSPISHLLTSGRALSQFKSTYKSLPLFASRCKLSSQVGSQVCMCRSCSGYTEGSRPFVGYSHSVAFRVTAWLVKVVVPKVFPSHTPMTRSWLKWVLLAPPWTGTIRDWGFFKGPSWLQRLLLRHMLPLISTHRPALSSVMVNTRPLGDSQWTDGQKSHGTKAKDHIWTSIVSAI